MVASAGTCSQHPNATSPVTIISAEENSHEPSHVLARLASHTLLVTRSLTSARVVSKQASSSRGRSVYAESRWRRVCCRKPFIANRPAVIVIIMHINTVGRSGCGGRMHARTMTPSHAFAQPVSLCAGVVRSGE